MRLKKAILINRAPFDKLELEFDDSNVFLLSGINGKGKTTILSYIVDSIYELAKKGYPNEFGNNSNKYYRVSSGLYSLDRQAFSIVYLRYITKDGKENDYIDIRGSITQEDYTVALGIDNPIPFSDISKKLEKNNNLKYWQNHSEKDSTGVFSAELMTYFPAYRYEQPYYLNTPYKPELKFAKDQSFTGYLENPIEVTSDFPEIANWMMDVVLDRYLYAGNSSEVFGAINSIISLILRSKTKQNVRLGIGQRYEGAERIAVMSTKDNSLVYPSVFLMSSGEMALERMVLKHIQLVMGHILRYRQHFIEVMERQLQLESTEKLQSHRKQLERCERRISELKRLFIKTYEDNANGNLSDERYEMMTQSYDTEQKQLESEVVALRQKIEVQERQNKNIERFVRTADKYVDIEEIDPCMLRELIKAIYVEAPDKSSGKRRQKIHIQYDGIGFIPLDELAQKETA